MIRLFAVAFAALSLSACGGDDVAAPAAAKAEPLTNAEKAMLLASLPAPYNQADLENGRRAFARCRSCHTLTEGGPNMTGPNLWGVFGRQAGSHPRYNYSNALSSAGFAWDAERLDHWLENPRRAACSASACWAVCWADAWTWFWSRVSAVSLCIRASASRTVR